MIDPELAVRLDAIEAKAEAAYQAAEKVRKYLMWSAIVAVALFVLPAIGLVFVIPQFISTYTAQLNGLGY